MLFLKSHLSVIRQCHEILAEGKIHLDFFPSRFGFPFFPRVTPDCPTDVAKSGSVLGLWRLTGDTLRDQYEDEIFFLSVNDASFE